MDLEEKKAANRERMRLWRIKNKDRWDEINARSRAKNADKIKARSRERYHATKHLKPPLTEEQKLIKAKNNRVHRLRVNYGLTLEDYDKMLEEQGGVCAICGKPDPTHPNLAVDHCHITGKIRGLLCRVCNPAIGALGDDVDSLRKVIAYLQRSLD